MIFGAARCDRSVLMSQHGSWRKSVIVSSGSVDTAGTGYGCGLIAAIGIFATSFVPDNSFHVVQ